MLDVIALQGSISASFLGMGVVFLALCAIGYYYARSPDRPFRQHESPGGTITIEGENKLLVDTPAKRLLGAHTTDVTSLASLSKRLSDLPHGAGTPENNVPFDMALEALVHAGTSFEALLKSATGDLVVAQGQPAGPRAIVRVRPATKQEDALSTIVAQQAATKEHANLLQAVTDGSVGATVCINDAGATLWQSRTFADLPKDTQDAIHQHAWSACHDPDTSPEEQVISRNGDGTLTHLGLQTRRLCDDLIVCSAVDISRQVEAESSFRRFVGTMADTFAHLKISLMIFDAERRLTLFNPATVDMIHMDAAWLAQRPTLKVLLDRLREARMTPDQPNFIEWRDRLLKATAPREKSDGDRGDARQEDIWHLANGRTLKVLARPHPSGGLAVVIEDITDAMALKRQSVSERAVHIATTDVLEEALVLFSPDGAARLSNAAFRSLWSLDADSDVTGRHVTDIARHCRTRAPDDHFWDELIECVTAKRNRVTITAKLSHKSGAISMARISPVPDGSVLAVFADITDSERIAAALTDRNDALEQAQEMRVALIDQISHQLRNPLNSVLGFSQMLSKGHCGSLNVQQTTYINGITAAADELLSAINGMTDIIDLDESLDEGAVGQVSARRLLADVAAIVNRRNGADVVHLTPPEAPLLTVPEQPAIQRGHLRQIIFNMITDTLTLSGTSPDDRAILHAEASLGMEGDTLVLTCRRESRQQRSPPTLAFAMAARLARILTGSISLDEAGKWRTLQCRLPLAMIMEAHVPPPQSHDQAALAPPAG